MLAQGLLTVFSINSEVVGNLGKSLPVPGGYRNPGFAKSREKKLPYSKGKYVHSYDS